MPRWWIAEQWNCARARTPSIHGGIGPPARPGRELDGVFTRSHDRLHQRNARVGCWISPCSMWGSHPSLGLHSITNDQRLGSLGQIVQLSFDEGCRSLPWLAGTGPVPHMALT